MTELLIGTSGWHYNDWVGSFYPPDITGYDELAFHAQHFNTVENNSSFYRIASESTYKTWDRMTPEGYVFSLKLNRFITHIHRLNLTDEVRERIEYIVQSTQVLGNKLGALLIQLPPSIRCETERLEKFLIYLTKTIRAQKYPFDLAIEFRHAACFTEEIYEILRRHNIALVASQSSRYPEVRQTTADFAYIRMHGPKKLFASKYSHDQLKEWASYIQEVSPQAKRVYVYFNNDFHGYAVQNAQELQSLLQ